MKRLMMSSVLVSLTFALAACQLQPVERSVETIGIQLIVPERVNVGSTTLAMKLSDAARVTESHIQVTPYETDDTRTYEVSEKDGYYVTSVTLEEGIYQVNGMVHEGQTVYTPTAFMVVGDVPEEELEAIKQPEVKTHDHGGGHHH